MKVTLTVEYGQANGTRPEYTVWTEPQFDCTDPEILSICEHANGITQRGDRRNAEHVLRWVLDEIERDPEMRRSRTWLVLGGVE